MSEIKVASISFEEGGVVVSYVRRDDIRLGGKVLLASQAQIMANHDDYGDEIIAIHRKVVRFLEDVLEDFNDSEPYEPEEDDDEPKGMGDH